MKEIDYLIDNNNMYYNYLLKTINTNPKVDDFFNIKYYANFLTNFYNKDNNFKIKTIKLLCDYTNEFWLNEAISAFNTLIDEIKKDKIKLSDIYSFLTSDKLLWGFTEFMKTATKESLLKHQNSLKHIELITRERKVDELIAKELASNENLK